MMDVRKAGMELLVGMACWRVGWACLLVFYHLFWQCGSATSTKRIWWLGSHGPGLHLKFGHLSFYRNTSLFTRLNHHHHQKYATIPTGSYWHTLPACIFLVLQNKYTKPSTLPLLCTIVFASLRFTIVLVMPRLKVQLTNLGLVGLLSLLRWYKGANTVNCIRNGDNGVKVWVFPSLSKSCALGSFFLSGLFFSGNKSGLGNLAAFGIHTISEATTSVPYVCRAPTYIEKQVIQCPVQFDFR